MSVERVNPKNKEHQDQHALTISEHIARYEFAKNFCEGKKVADIACGTGYGMEIIGGDVTGVVMLQGMIKRIYVVILSLI